MKPNLYFVAIVLSEPVQTEITQFKFYIREKYGWKVALKSLAHITLIPPFHLMQPEEENLVHHLQLFQPDIKELSIELHGFGHFGKRTIFVSVVNNELLNNLYHNLNYHFQNVKILEKSNKEKAATKLFRPHVTLANRDIEGKYFDEVWNFFREKNYSATITETKYSLLKHDGNNWQAIKDISF